MISMLVRKIAVKEKEVTETSSREKAEIRKLVEELLTDELDDERIVKVAELGRLHYSSSYDDSFDAERDADRIQFRIEDARRIVQARRQSVRRNQEPSLVHTPQKRNQQPREDKEESESPPHKKILSRKEEVEKDTEGKSAPQGIANKLVT